MSYIMGTLVFGRILTEAERVIYAPLSGLQGQYVVYHDDRPWPPVEANGHTYTTLAALSRMWQRR